MTTTEQAPTPVEQPKELSEKDIKHRIEKQVHREMGQDVRAIHLWSGFWRINWYKRLESNIGVCSHRVEKSQFSWVTVNADDSVTIEDRTVQPKKYSELEKFLK